MKPIVITEQTLPDIHAKLDAAIAAKKSYQLTITVHDSSLKARQRALCYIWYKEIGEEQGETAAYVEAVCKLSWGFAIRCENDPELERIIRAMLDFKSYEDKIKIIIKYKEFFPVHRDDGGMNTDQQGRYLSLIQRGMAEQGIILTSLNDDEVAKYPEAQR